MPTAALSFQAAAKGDFAPLKRRVYSQLAALPAMGVVARFTMTQPHDAALPALAFGGARPSAPQQLAYSIFAQPAAPELAPRQAKQDRTGLRSAGKLQAPSDAGQPAGDPLLAYAPQSAPVQAPFDAVMGGIRTDASGDTSEEGLPRPRPADATLAAWLNGRAAGQFRPGQHAWVQNLLPASVQEPRQQKCLAEGIYFEARGESETGQAAVAQVILNRVRNPTYPDTICDVVYQNKDLRGRCQFSFACDGIPDRVTSRYAWGRAVAIARDVTEGRTWIADVGDSTHYYAYYVRPDWAKRMIQADRIGAHLFYRTRYGGWS